ncbi:tripartite tricarboxylate transporter substrate binding protein [Pigmentiphaga litoralis]|uniref:Tripartite-type tricarboxylate transporter receptor subunit TctC n=1 Tax=Pigmentiphaga litoralis TaxID=516702 RepID=A0A7Y9LQ20_9BURK|nr:tripartite tricarboxylate transporter substrate binding protein [Pigmentiphaga litoralis]NYE26200.1 tripartite-type tricarboxylate transporter receptor subunit TctC [Pigmentiphaga litoralis]NYE85320.1 tripartite-type tricarboxylate transporter receptor subunit TctC [Pigmentiphaga litoralis]
MNRTPLLHWTAAAALGVLPALASAQTYPTRPITLVVPFAAGGGTDSIARDVAKTLGDKLGQTVVVDNRGGGGGSIGATMVANAKPDGYTLLFATSTFVTNAASEINATYDVEKSYAPVAMIGRGPLFVVTSKELGVKNITQLRALGQARADGINFCSAGNGSINHLAGELFHQRSGLNMTHVPYKGSGPATVDLLAGRVQLFFATVPTILTHVQSNRVDLLAVTGAKRSPLFPDVPTMAEAGVPNFNITTWWGVLAPAKTPVALVNQLNQAINDVAAADLVRNRLVHEGADPISGSPADFKRALSSELALWKGVVKTSGMKLQ